MEGAAGGPGKKGALGTRCAVGGAASATNAGCTNGGRRPITGGMKGAAEAESESALPAIEAGRRLSVWNDSIAGAGTHNPAPSAE